MAWKTVNSSERDFYHYEFRGKCPKSGEVATVTVCYHGKNRCKTDLQKTYNETGRNCSLLSDTRLLIPDNLKTGVISNTRYETLINRSYHEMAEHYDTAIVPARVEHPKDKSLAEGSVKFASTWIIAALRNRKFFTIDEVRQAVSEKLEELNHYPFKKRKGNRYDAYVEECVKTFL